MVAAIRWMAVRRRADGGYLKCPAACGGVLYRTGSMALNKSARGTVAKELAVSDMA